MNTDEEINRRVAEIEDVDFNFSYQSDPPYIRRTRNYTANWDECGPLIEKYKIYLVVEYDEAGEPFFVSSAGGECVEDKIPQRAICLAVIAAHD